MSFGVAAHANHRAGSACPCGGGSFGGCCGPILAGTSAVTAEQLMRSRFTAFALGDARHVQVTWHPRTAPASIDFDEAVRWDRLEILRTEAGGRGDEGGLVEFRAHWRDAATGERGALHETSRFRRIGDRWFYLDGNVRDDRASD